MSVYELLVLFSVIISSIGAVISALQIYDKRKEKR